LRRRAVNHPSAPIRAMAPSMRNHNDPLRTPKESAPVTWGGPARLVAIGGNDGRLPGRRKGGIGADHTLTNSQTLSRSLDRPNNSFIALAFQGGGTAASHRPQASRYPYPLRSGSI
jgi:hypothetical protein